MRNVVTIGFALGMAWGATACRVDMNVGDWLMPELEPGNGHGNGNGQGNGNGNGNGNGGSSSTGGGGNTAGAPEAGAVCIDLEEGSATSCKDVATWKMYASQSCEGDGQMLSDYAPREECGEGLYRYVDYTCCPVPPAPDPNGCVKQEQGGQTSCKDVATWKQYASQTCESGGQMLSDYAPREECGEGLYRYVDYTCCPLPPTEPPSTPGCVTQEQGGPTSCKDVATWKQYSAQACESSGMLFTDYAPREECGVALYRYVDYTCCPNPTPPTPPTDCIYPAQGGPTSCKDVATWKLYASQDCEAGGRVLTDYETEDECGDGLYRYVKYTCCP